MAAQSALVIEKGGKFAPETAMTMASAHAVMRSPFPHHIENKRIHLYSCHSIVSFDVSYDIVCDSNVKAGFENAV
ncbi:hypothetical protein [Ferrovibrio sp.]|uniref:hypothetical protein n=1 Tax=Ferrovibrio sp. TaxID=1917215 RepID=UPI0039190613